ncbi:hypothetical protein ANME2D_03006 [Candidatus Methanoperedens nitroreducens]|uniref:Antitoxin n=2 Tax=Candidatus Methanoperedens nitratireducens TaxID=1392998 RepID=A0A062V0U3_9EURY|nr:hypothetical protein ANME2D_03006 [Candidatus Methanoperedens nitroreducens]
MPKIIECIYENGMFKPLEKVELKGGKKVKILLREDREDILDKYAGIVKIGRFARIEDILESEGETWLY